MKQRFAYFCIVSMLILSGLLGRATAAPAAIVVDINGKGDFRSIQEAINSLPENSNEFRVIYIRNGVYREKIFLEKNFVALVGEDTYKTQIRISQARDIWRCNNKDDWGVATVNLKGSDIVLENLTISNDFGFDLKEEMHIDCPPDSLNPFKTVTKSGHQMALRSFGTTRLIARNCIFKAFGGDTVSPWNVEEGQFYFKDCEMEGGVDFYCPRGWAYAENCVFNAHGKVAAIWHDGSAHKDSKTVLRHCIFKGEDGFKLGRYHKDAQFYLLDCQFADNMADAPIYLNPSKPQNKIQWGERIYFFNCHRNAGDYAWFKDNLNQAEGNPDPKNIHPSFVFGTSWHPEDLVFQKSFPSKTAGHQKGLLKDNGMPVDSMAERMLVYQRAVGGWPKAVNEVKVDYHRTLSVEAAKAIMDDASHDDATFDNEATSREIRYLMKAYKATENKRYLQAAEKGIAYCLKAQNANGGWPQYYPDTRLYRAQITYNDNAMVNVLNILGDIAEQKNDFELVSPLFVQPCKIAIQKAIRCILKTQIIVHGKLTAWCTQYNPRTLVPEMARKFELVSLSANESVGVIRFLMRQQQPDQAIRQSIIAAVNWLKAVQIQGFKYTEIPAPDLPRGKDRVILPDNHSVIWSRFYEIETNRPMFSGRDSQKKYKVSEIEHERRIGYAWYGTWPAKLLDKEYPEWKKQNNITD